MLILTRAFQHVFKEHHAGNTPWPPHIHLHWLQAHMLPTIYQQHWSYLWQERWTSGPHQQTRRQSAGFAQSHGSLEKSWENREGLSRVGKVVKKIVFCLAGSGKCLWIFQNCLSDMVSLKRLSDKKGDAILSQLITLWAATLCCSLSSVLPSLFSEKPLCLLCSLKSPSALFVLWKAPLHSLFSEKPLSTLCSLKSPSAQKPVHVTREATPGLLPQILPFLCWREKLVQWVQTIFHLIKTLKSPCSLPPQRRSH